MDSRDNSRRGLADVLRSRPGARAASSPSIDGLMAVYRSSFFAGNAVFVFSDLKTWGWITFGLGALGIVSGLAVFSGREWARWTGITVAGLGALGQMLFAQAYPLWSLMIMGVYLLAVYGLAVYGVRESAARSGSSYRSESTSDETSRAPLGRLRRE